MKTLAKTKVLFCLITVITLTVIFVACIIAKIIDAYCNDLVEEAVAECTRQGRCSIIGAEHCSVTCIDPKPQR